MFDSKSVTSILSSALLSVNDSLTKSQVEDIKEYIYVGEWRLAFETLCSFLYEEEVNISQESYKLIEEVGNCLSIDSNTWKVIESQVIT